MDAFILEQAIKLQSKIENIEEILETLKAMKEKTTTEKDYDLGITFYSSVSHGHEIREINDVTIKQILHQTISLYENKLKELQVAFKEL